jgi:hypothetical protein
LFGEGINTIKEKSETILEAGMAIGLQINAEKTDHVSSSELRTEPERKDS